MSAVAQAPSSPSPGDEDLQYLYDEVWASFADEPSSTERDSVDNIYSDYSSDYPTSPTLTSPTSTNKPVTYTHGGFPKDNSRSLPPNPPAKRPQSTKGVRPLPPTPGGSSSVSSPTNSFSMPEPEPYFEPARAGHYSADSGSSDLLKKATAGSVNGRRLPQAPVATNGSPGRSARVGLPSDVRPAYRMQRDSSGSNADSPASANSRNGYGSGDWTSDNQRGSYTGATVSTSRPAGALAPSMPGQVYGAPDDPRGHSADEVSNALNGYHHKLADSHRYDSPPPGSPPNLGVNNGLPPRTNNEHITAQGYTASPEGLSPYGSYLDPNLGRSVSTGSLTSPNGYMNRPLPPTAPTSYVNSSRDSNGGRSNSFAASVGRGNSTGSGSDNSQMPQLRPQDSFASYGDSSTNLAGPSNYARQPSDVAAPYAPFEARGPLELHVEGDDEYWEDEDEDDSRFVNFSLLSHIAVQLRDKVPRGTHVKGSVRYPRAFTGKDIVSTIQAQIQRELAINHGVSTSDRRAALQVARSLQSQLFFYEVEWGSRILQDGVEDVYMFLDDQEGEAIPEREELPTGVITILTKCYSTTCSEEFPCYSYACPRKGNSLLGALAGTTEAPSETSRGEWSTRVEREVLESLPESEINRQTIIHKVISKEEQYVQDLDIVESSFIKPLRMANPPVIEPYKLEDFIDDVFGNILDLRECNRRLLEVMYVRQREQFPVIQRIGDVFLDAATEFRLAYPIYVGHLPLAEKRMKEEMDTNPEFRLFLEQCSRESARNQDSLRLDLKHLLNRPSEHLQKYPVLLEAIFHETAVGNPDADYVQEAIEAIKNLQSVAQLRTFQSAMGKGITGKWEWHDLVSTEIRKSLTKEESKRQSIIFELIKGEMAYVKDLENIELMYVRPLRAADPPIIPPERLDQFILDVFHNFAELHAHHRRLLDRLQEIQREEHPLIRSITAPVLDAALNFREAYLEYIPNYPIAAYRIGEEMENNAAFKAFVEQCVRHPDAHRLDMKSFINRPIPRLLRYELLLKGILDETPSGHEDRDSINSIPNVLEVIKALGKETEPGVVSSKQKVEIWRYNSNLVFKPGESIDMDLLNEQRSLIHSGKLLRQPETGFEWNGWSELFVLLFDNYMVMTKPKEKDGVTKYHVNRRPIPLDLLTLVNFTDPPTQRGAGILRGLRGGERHVEGANPSTPGVSPDNPTDSRAVYPCTLHHNGRLGGPYILYAESAQIRTEWKQKLDEAIGLREAVQESNKVFEVETLSTDTFLVPSMVTGATPPSWNHENSFTGKVTCSVPFNTADGRGLVAIGCAEGVWIGFRHDSRSMRRVLHVKMVTQCAMLEDFGIFLVLADKCLFAYHIEALVPSSPQSSHASQTPQKLNGTKDVHFFSVGTMHGRTLVIYMKKKGLDSVFRVLEPVVEKINEKVKAPAGFGSRLGFRSARSEWFRVYRDFFLPSESFDLIFLKAKIAVLCTKGFEIMDLTDFKSVTIPLRDDPRLEKLAKRCESCRPMGMFRSGEDEFLLCYDEFGLYVNKHGDPSRSAGTIEWEGTAERVALHHPYVLLFDSRFIEIRHVETGRLAQIISGNDVRCIWDGRGLNAHTVTSHGQDGFDDRMVQEARVHGVMNAPEPTAQQGTRPSRAVAQHVFELIPTIPLYLPGSLASPSTMTYFQSSSPPRSPPLQPSASWRS